MIVRFLANYGVVLAGLLWPLLTRLGLGRLPGDLAIERGRFRFYVPFTTGVLV